jgi:serine O-acetyltransferase
VETAEVMNNGAQPVDDLEPARERPAREPGHRFENVRADYDAYVFASWTWVPDGRRRSKMSRRWEEWGAVVFRGLWPSVVLYRLCAWARRRGIPLLPFVADSLNRFIFGVIIGKDVEIGPGFCIAHGSIVIDGKVKIGKNCAINPYVTVGLSTSSKIILSLNGPTIGDNVYIGTGARVLGPIRIGNNAKISANAVVLTDVPDNHTAVGVPARVIPQKPPKTSDDTPEDSRSAGPDAADS